MHSCISVLALYCILVSRYAWPWECLLRCVNNCLFQSIRLSKVRSHSPGLLERGSESEGTPPPLTSAPAIYTYREIQCQTSKCIRTKLSTVPFSRGSIRQGNRMETSNEFEYTALSQWRFPSVSVTTVSRNFPTTPGLASESGEPVIH